MRLKKKMMIAITLMLTIVASIAGVANAGAPSWDAIDKQTQLTSTLEPYIAVKSDASPDTLVAIANQGSICQTSRSTDGGSSWPLSGKATLQNPGWANGGSTDPVIASDTTGKFYAVCLGIKTGQSGGVWYSTSTDGVGWSAPLDIVQETQNNVKDDKEWVAIDKNTASPFKDRVYACWTKMDDTDSLNKKRDIQFKYIGGTVQTRFSITNANDNNMLNGCYVAVGPVQNEVYLTWAHYKSSTSIDIYLTRSDDGGITWQPNRAIALVTRLPTCNGAWPLGSITGNAGGCSQVDSYPRMAVDYRSSTGIHLVWTHYSGTTDKADIFYKNSYNCGKNSNINNCTFNTSTVTPGVRINSVATKDQFEPAIEIRKSTTYPQGTVHVTALDRRSDTNNVKWETWHYHCHLTSVGGCSGSGDWTGPDNQKLVSNFQTDNHAATRIGDYHGNVGTSSREAHAVWADSRNSSTTWDIYADRTTGS